METLTINELKKICKLKHIKNYSKLNKKELVKIITELISVIKIQRCVRKHLSKCENCPISLEKIRYPCYPYKTNSGAFVYYNLPFLNNYLIDSGNFRDPITREKFTQKNLEEIDCIFKYYDTSSCINSVLKASNNKNFYKKMKDMQNNLLSLESMLDNLTQDIIIVIRDRDINFLYILLDEYQVIFKRIAIRSKENAEYCIKKTIEHINFLIENSEYDNRQLYLTDCAMSVLYQMNEDFI